MTNAEICMNKIKAVKILFCYRTKNKVQKQIYTVDTSEVVLISGMCENGYMLKSYPENTPSNTCMKYIDLLRILRGEEIDQHVFKVSAIL